MSESLEVPEHLKSTVEMLQRAFPDGIAPHLRKPILRALYDHMSDRNLAEMASFVMGPDDGAALNQVWEAAQLDPDDEDVREMIQRLHGHGFVQWCRDDP